MENRQLESLPSLAAAGSNVFLSEAMLLRVGGLPFSATERLKDGSVGAAIERSRWLETVRLAQAQDVSDLLHAAVGRVKENASLQRTLLAVRRDIFNRRRPSTADLEIARTHLPGETLEALEAWCQTTAELEVHSTGAESALKDAMVRGREELKHLACLPDFRKGLLLSSASFEKALDDYVRADVKHLDRKLRKTERTLLSYLLRTTHKTSPFSTFTPVCFVRVSDDPAAPATPSLDGYRIWSAVKPNIGVVSRVAQALTQHPIDFPHLLLTVQPGALVSGNRITYWKRNETAIRADGPVHTKVSEHTFWVHRTASLQVLLNVMASKKAMSVAEIQAVLTKQLRMGEPEALEYIRLLVENGLFILAGLRQSVFDEKGWSKFTEQLQGMEDAQLVEIGQRLQTIQDEAKLFGDVPVAQRPRKLEAIEANAQAALDLSRSTAAVPRPTLFEDSRASDVALHVKASAWAEAAADLAELQSMLSLFDPLLIPKVSLKSLFKKKYKATFRCDDLLAFSDYFHEMFYRPYQLAATDAARKADQHFSFGRGTLNPLKLPEIFEILDARAELSSILTNALAKDSAADEVVLPSESVQQLGAQLLAKHKLLSNSFFVQAAERRGKLDLVLNHIYGGFGCMYTRFTHLFAGSGPDSLEELLRSNVTSLRTPGTIFAEFQGGHDTNLNQHNLLTEAEIVYPGERGTLPEAQQIAITDLTIRYSPETDEIYLFCDRLQKRIVPLYLGMLYPLVLPELQTLFLHFSPPTVLKSELAPKHVPQGEPVLYQPRIRYKRVVLERAKWTVEVKSIPIRAKQEGDFSYLLRLANWRFSLNVPQQVFAKLAFGEGHDGAAALYGGVQQKPFYLDFENPFCVSLLEKVLADSSGYISFTEMLPTSHDAAVQHDGDPYVSEFVLEITQRYQS